MIELPRRRFITGLASLIAAPAIVKASSIMPVRSFFVPQRWLPCDGRAVRVRDYPELFGAIAGLYGFSFADRTFNVPDLRGRMVYSLNNDVNPMIPSIRTTSGHVNLFSGSLPVGTMLDGGTFGLRT